MVMRPWLRPLFCPRRARRRSRPWPVWQVLRLEPLETRDLPSFVAPLSYDAGTNPTAVATGDFNGDGILDLAVANNIYNGTVSVLLGTGNGTFGVAHTFAAGTSPESVVVGDFNGDGILDLAVANHDSNDVSILLGKGDGTFQTARTFNAGSFPTSVAVGDFNGDGIPDLAVTSLGTPPFYDNPRVSVYLGNGDGTFHGAGAFFVGPFPTSVAVGDFNGDGKPDLAVVSPEGYVGILLGNGDGTFQAMRDNFIAGNALSVVVGDFNGDGIPDLAIANQGDHRLDPGRVSVLLGNGDGSFQPARTFAAGFGPSSVAVGDFNGDGIPDLAAADSEFPGGVSVLLGNGDGSFQAARTFTAGSNPSFVVVGDFNDDGILDLAVANKGSANVNVLLGTGDGTVHAAPSYAAGSFPESVAVGDFNGDGIPDLAVANQFSGTVSVLLGNGNGTFQPARTFAAGGIYSYSVVVGDFNGDGIPDLAVTDNGYPNGTVSILLGVGDGTFQPARTFAVGSYPQAVVVGDFNGDGIPDLAVANSGSNTVSVLLGVGDGTFHDARGFAVGNRAMSVVVGDFNGDGIPDLAVANYLDDNVSVLLGNGDGSFQARRDFVTDALPVSVVVGDFNGDGILDLAVANEDNPPPYQASVSVLLGNGDGTFGAARTFNTGFGVSSVAVGDFNGDGTLDLAVANWSSNTVRVLLGTGDGSFRTFPFSYVAGLASVSLAVGDFNGDGYPDLAVANQYSNDVSILLNDTSWPTGPGRTGGGHSPAVRPGPRATPAALLAAGLPLNVPAPDTALPRPESPPSLPTPILDAFWALPPQGRQASLEHPAARRPVRPAPAAWSDDLLLAALAADESILPEWRSR